MEQSQRRLEQHVAFADLRGWSQAIKQSARGERVHRELRGLCWEHFEELVHDAMECELQLISFAQAKYIPQPSFRDAARHCEVMQR